MAHLRVLIAGAAKMGVPVVNTFVGADAARPLRENIEAARGSCPTWSPTPATTGSSWPSRTAP